MKNISSTLLELKSEQLRSIGLSSEEEFFLNDILSAATATAGMAGREDLLNCNQLLNSSYLYNLYNPFYGVAYPMACNSAYMGNNSYNVDTYNCSSDCEHAGSSSTKSTLPNTIDEFKFVSKSKEVSIQAKIQLMKKVLGGVQDDNQVLITAKPKNRSKKIRKSNRHSQFRGVSLNGK